MPKNKIKYVYYTIGFLRGGPVHRAIQADAEELDAQEPTVAKFRLAQFYELRDSSHLLVPNQEMTAINNAEPAALAADLAANADEAVEAWPE